MIGAGEITVGCAVGSGVGVGGGTTGLTVGVTEDGVGRAVGLTVAAGDAPTDGTLVAGKRGVVLIQVLAGVITTTS